MSWTSDIVDGLCDLKRAGYSYEAAWQQMMLTHRPRGRDRGVPAGDLFEAAEVGETSLEFLRRACDDAWHGRRPALRHIGALLDGGFEEAERVQYQRRGNRAA